MICLNKVQAHLYSFTEDSQKRSQRQRKTGYKEGYYQEETCQEIKREESRMMLVVSHQMMVSPRLRRRQLLLQRRQKQPRWMPRRSSNE